jgi:two-component system sensor histidine kinase HydH
MQSRFNIQPGFILLISGIIALIMIFGGIFRIHESRNEIYHVLQEEAYSLAETIDRASANIILSSDEIERQIADRLLTAGSLIAQLDSVGSLGRNAIESIADENDISRIDILGRGGRLLRSNRTAAEDDWLQSESVRQSLAPLLQGRERTLVIGTIQAGSDTGRRLVVAVCRTARAGGAIVLSSGIDEFSELKRTIGIGKLIRDLGNNSGIEYAALQDRDGIIAASDSVDQLSSFSDDSTLAAVWEADTSLTRQIVFHHREVFETLRPLIIGGERIALIRIGFSLDEVRSIEQKAERRNILRSIIFFFVALLTITALTANQNFRLSRRRIQAMETFTGNILEHMQDAVVSVDAGGRITIFNRRAEELLGERANAVLGKSFDDLTGPVGRRLKKIFSSGESELTLDDASRTARTLSISISTTKAAGGSTESRTAVIKDLTEARRLEREVQRKEKLTAMGELASGVAHEVRNPLNAISMIAQRYDREFTPRTGLKEYRKLTHVLKKESTRVNGIIQQFLTFARPPKLNLTKVQAADFTSYIATLFKSQAKKKGVRFRSRCETDDSVSLDHGQMTQALLNILQNALDATKRGDTISLRVYRKEKSIVFEIADSGSGIPAEIVDRIFDHSFTTKARGSGMGLAITQQIVTQHRGNIEVKSEPSKGTVFTVSIPLRV